MASDRSKKSHEAPALPRPPVFALPPTKSSPQPRASLAPPAPPPVPAPAPTVSHELFDVDAAAVNAVARRAAERASARPHPPRKSFKPGDLPPADGAKPAGSQTSEDSAQRLSTPLSWTAAKNPTPEEAPEDLLEPVVDSAPLALPPIVAAEPLASAIPTGSVVVPPPHKASERRWGTVSVVALGAIGLIAVGSVLGASQDESDDARGGTARVEAATNESPANVVPATPAPALELELGVPESPPEEPTKTETAIDPSAVPPVAPSGVLPTRPVLVEKPPFDQKAAAQALGQAAQVALSCRKDGDPKGSATVIVRYAPSGRVTSATVEAGPFAGTVTGGCIATTFRKALVPAFSGDYMTVKRTVTFK